MTVLCTMLILYGVLFLGASCFWLGRASVKEPEKSDCHEEASLSENERKTLRELQNFLQYDGFTRP